MTGQHQKDNRARKKDNKKAIEELWPARRGQQEDKEMTSASGGAFWSCLSRGGQEESRRRTSSGSSLQGRGQGGQGKENRWTRRGQEKDKTWTRRGQEVDKTRTRSGQDEDRIQSPDMEFRATARQCGQLIFPKREPEPQ